MSPKTQFKTYRRKLTNADIKYLTRWVDKEFQGREDNHCPLNDLSRHCNIGSLGYYPREKLCWSLFGDKNCCPCSDAGHSKRTMSRRIKKALRQGYAEVKVREPKR